MKKPLLLALLISFICIITALPTKNIAVSYLNPKKTAFKKALLDSLISSNPEYKFTVVEYKQLFKSKNSNYDAYIVFDQLEAWTLFNRKLKASAKKLDPQKTIYYITAGDPDWNWKKEGIITISSASKKENISKMKIEINQKLHDILNK